MSQNQPAQPPTGSQQNLAARQGYPGYQRSFETLAPALPEIQPASYPGYNQQPIAPIILSPPQPPQPKKRHPLRNALVALVALLLLAGGGTGYFFYTNQQNTIHARATATVTTRNHLHATASARARASATP